MPIQAVALYDFAGSSPSELSFSAGDIIWVFQREEDENDWWSGQVHGVEGFFPGNFVEISKEERPESLSIDEILNKGYLHLKPSQWDKDNVAQFLKAHNMNDMVIDLICESGMNGQKLLALESETLEQYGVDVEDRVSILNAIAVLNDDQPMPKPRMKPRSSSVIERGSKGIIGINTIPPPLIITQSHQGEMGMPFLPPWPESAKPEPLYEPRLRTSSSPVPPTQQVLRTPIPSTAIPTSPTSSTVKGGPGVFRRQKSGPNLFLPEVSALDIEDPDHHGWITKQGGGHKSWKRRWFMLKGTLLYYFKTPDYSKALGLINLSQCTVSEAAEINKHFAFKVTPKRGTDQRVYFLYCDCFIEMTSWIKKINLASKIDAGL